MSGRAARWIAAIVVTLVVLLVVADRVAVAVAERVAGDTLQSSENLASRPDVDIAGFPFLTQLATGRFDKVTVSAHDVPVGQQAHLLVLSRLNVVLHHLSVSRDFHTFHARTATATGVADFDALSKALGITLRYAGAGRVRASEKLTIAGASLDATITARPALVHGAVRFVDAAVANAGSIGSETVTMLERAFDLEIPLDNVPFHVTVRALQVAADGLTIGLAGRDISYTT